MEHDEDLAKSIEAEEEHQSETVKKSKKKKGKKCKKGEGCPMGGEVQPKAEAIPPVV